MRKQGSKNRRPCQQLRGGRGPIINNNTLSEKPQFRCPVCLCTFPSWTKLTTHLDKSMHLSARCIACLEKLKCYGPTQPHRHEDIKKHRGFIGVFYAREDYKIEHPPMLSIEQYRCECRVTFLNPIHLVMHLRHDHGVNVVQDIAKCLTCNIQGSLNEMEQHRLSRLDIHHKFKFINFSVARFIVMRPKLPPWKAEETDYAIQYQCPICRVIFGEWSLMQGHMDITGHCRDVLPQTTVHGSEDTSNTLIIGGINNNSSSSSNTINTNVSRSGSTQNINNNNNKRRHHVYSPQDFEVTVDRNDPIVCAQVRRSVAESVGTDDEEFRIVFQCPALNCTFIFLSHGELMEHMLQTSHRPPPPPTQLGATSTTTTIIIETKAEREIEGENELTTKKKQEEEEEEEEKDNDNNKDEDEETEENEKQEKELLSGIGDVAAYEVSSTVTQLIEIFGFSQCQICRFVLSPGAEELHRQLYHSHISSQ